MGTRFQDRMGTASVARDAATVAGLIEIWCDAHHQSEPRRKVETEAALLGIYGHRTPKLCRECEEHLAYAEGRLVYCPKDPKPFCAQCDVHCYSRSEREWQRTMMRYSGPRSLFTRHAPQALRHMFEGLAFRIQTRRRRQGNS